MPITAQPTVSDAGLFNRAFEATRELTLHIKGEKNLPAAHVDACKYFIREASGQSIYFFAKAVLGFSKLTPQTHRRWCIDLQETFFEHDFLMRLKPRETYKTTIYGEAFILWIWACVSPHIRIMYTSANGSLLQEVSAHLDTFVGLESESLYSFVFGIKRDKNQRPNTSDVFNIIGKDRSVKGNSLMFRTAGGSVNGVHPHIIIVDDPMDKEDRESATIRRKKERWFDSLFPLLSGYTWQGMEIKKIMFIATRWHMDDLVSYIMKKNAEKEVEEDKFQIEREGVYTETGAVRYPEFFPESKIRKIKSNISSVFFACQYLNNPLPEGLQIFEKDKMHFLNMSFVNIREGANYCFLDPSRGKTKSDFPAVVWVNLHNKRLYFFDAIDKRIKLSELIRLIAEKNRIYAVSEMIFEDNGSNLIAETIEQAHQDIDYSIKITPITHSTNKDERIVSMQPHCENGSVVFRLDYEKAYPEMMNQIFYYPAWGNDDFPDIVETAISYLRKGAYEFVYIGADGEVNDMTYDPYDASVHEKLLDKTKQKELIDEFMGEGESFDGGEYNY